MHKYAAFDVDLDDIEVRQQLWSPGDDEPGDRLEDWVHCPGCRALLQGPVRVEGSTRGQPRYRCSVCGEEFDLADSEAAELQLEVGEIDWWREGFGAGE